MDRYTKAIHRLITNNPELSEEVKVVLIKDDNKRRHFKAKRKTTTKARKDDWK